MWRGPMFVTARKALDVAMNSIKPSLSNQNVLPRAFAGLMVAPLLLLGACTTTDVAPSTDIDPPIPTLAALKVVEEFPAEGNLTVKRHQADAQGRFVLSISPLDGVERERAFGVAESVYGRVCGQPPGSTVNGVGRTGSRAPLFDIEATAYLVYMQCAGAPVAPVGNG